MHHLLYGWTIILRGTTTIHNLCNREICDSVIQQNYLPKLRPSRTVQLSPSTFTINEDRMRNTVLFNLVRLAPLVERAQRRDQCGPCKPVDNQDDNVTLGEGRTIADELANVPQKWTVGLIVYYFKKSLTSSTLHIGTTIHPLTIRSGLLSRYPNISLRSIDAGCGRMTQCNNDVDEHTFTGKRRYRRSQHWLGRQPC